MREIDVSVIEQAVCDLCIKANRVLPADVQCAVCRARDTETDELPHSIMQDICDNIEAADKMGLPICQDTGMAVVFADIGQEVHLTGGLLADAVNGGVHRGYTEGLLRCSVVGDPLRRINTGDNTPAVLHTRIVAGDRVTLTVAPKGFGSENMSRVYMLTPAADRQGVIDAVLDAVKRAGSNPCPPMVLGVGIGGDFEMCALLAKRALCRSLDVPHPDPYYAELERELLDKINALGIGPQGFGGNTTALHVAVETYPTHIAGLPVAVNVGCHVTRHATVEL